MAFRKCNKCNVVKGKEEFADGFVCSLCATKPAGGAATPNLSPNNVSPVRNPQVSPYTSPQRYGAATDQTAAGRTGYTSPYKSPLVSPSNARQTGAPLLDPPVHTPGGISPRVPPQHHNPAERTVDIAGGWQRPPVVSPAAAAPLAPTPGKPFQPRRDSPKWKLSKATLQNEFKSAFMVLETNFESVATGRPIAFHELFTQQRDYTFKKADSTFGLCLMCDACTQLESTVYGDTQLFKKVWLCDLCSRNEDIILKKRNNAAQHLMVQTKRCFDMADVDGSGGLDYLEYVHWAMELSLVIPCVPQKPMLMFLREVFSNFCEMAPDGKAVISWKGVQDFFDTCFKAVPPHCEEQFYRHSDGQRTMVIWRFIRLLISIFYSKCVYLQPEMRDRSTRKANEKPTFSFRQAPKIAKSFRGAIPKYDCSLLRRKRLLGKGGLCEAWLCSYQGNDVVAKVPLPQATSEEVRKMFRAARTQMKFDHENILRVLGVFEDATPPTILLELAEGGDVSDLIVGRVDMPTQWRLAKEIAEGLHCLHTNVPFPFAHRDLKGMNVFLTKDLHAKLADFDFLIEIPEGVLVSGMCGTPGYIAPEMLQGPGYDHRVDIWSYASLLYEITHAMNPYSKEVCGSRGPMSIDRWVPMVLEITMKGLRPELNPRICPEKMRRLIEDCWRQNPDQRPDTLTIINRLDEMEHDFDD